MQSKGILTAVLICSVCGVIFLAAFIAADALPAQDLTQYWAAARLVRKNPYSSVNVAKLEESAGIVVADQPLVLKNPPWAIPFILPLGFFSYRVAFAFWTVFSVLVVAGCARTMWQQFERTTSLFSILLPILFGPTLVLLMLGQWTVLVLLGITGFLVMAEHKRGWSAGAFLVLVMGKPHVALLFLIVVALYIFRSKRWAIFFSAAICLLSSSLLMLAINPHVFAQFLQRTKQVVNENVPYPNLGGMLYVVSGKHMLALLPQAVGVLWLFLYWKRHQENWDWKANGMLVLVVSIASSYYSYPYDEILVLPAMVTAYVTGNKRVFLFCFGTVQLGYALYLCQVAGIIGFGYMFLWWTAIGWLVTYCFSRTSRFRLGTNQAFGEARGE